MKKNLRELSTIVVFLLFIFGITTISLLKEDIAFSENENRYLAGKPELSVNDLLNGSFETNYEEYIEDQFILRDTWISLKTGFDLVINKKDVNSVYFGKDNYLIEKHDEVELNSSQAWKNYYYLQNFVEKYKGLNFESLKVMLVPNSIEIMKNKLPDYLKPYSQKTLISKINNIIGTEYTVNLAEKLKKHNKEYIYYRTDHHWTTLGAYYAYNIWCDEIGIIPNTLDDFKKTLASDEFYGTIDSKVNIKIKPDSIYLYDLIDEELNYTIKYNGGENTTNSLYNMEALETKDKYSVFLGGNNPLLEIETNVKNGKNLLIIKDSYAHSLVPFLINNFEKITVVDLRYYNLPLSNIINKKMYTDILVLYNIATLSADNNIFKILN